MQVELERFQCLFCRECCYFSEEYEMPTVFPWEKRLLEEMGQRMGVVLEFKPLQAYMDSEGHCIVTLYRWVIRGYCPFLDVSTARCRIHGSKPLACRMYPLILEMPSGKLMVSFKCKWVADRGKRFFETLSSNPELIPKVFPDEFKAAVEAYAEITSIARFVESKGMKPLKLEELDKCKEVYDVDEYIARFG